MGAIVDNRVARLGYDSPRDYFMENGDLVIREMMVVLNVSFNAVRLAHRRFMEEYYAKHPDQGWR